LILSSTPLHNLLLTISLTADDFAYYFTYKTTTISSQFSASHIQELKPATLTDKNLLSSLSSLSDEELYLLSQMKLLISSHPTPCPIDPIPSPLLQAISPTLLPTHCIQVCLGNPTA